MIYLLGGVGIVIAVLLTALGFEHERVVYETNRAVNAELAVKTAKQEADAWRARWAAQVDYADAQKRKDDAEREQTFKELESRAKVGGKCVAPRDISGLLADIARAANAARAAGVDQSSGDAVSRSAQKR